jgi:hypothetical protein
MEGLGLGSAAGARGDALMRVLVTGHLGFTGPLSSCSRRPGTT